MTRDGLEVTSGNTVDVDVLTNAWTIEVERVERPGVRFRRKVSELNPVNDQARAIVAATVRALS